MLYVIDYVNLTYQLVCAVVCFIQALREGKGWWAAFFGWCSAFVSYGAFLVVR